jgi:hypothetical protein
VNKLIKLSLSWFLNFDTRPTSRTIMEGAPNSSKFTNKFPGCKSIIINERYLHGENYQQSFSNTKQHQTLQFDLMFLLDNFFYSQYQSF